MAQPKTEKKCPTCETLFYVHPSIAETRRCCSVKCQRLWRMSTRVVKKCDICSVDMELRPSDVKVGRRFCGRKCWSVEFSRLMVGNKHKLGIPSWIKGLPKEKHPAWRGGLGSPNRSRKATGSFEYREWRSAVFTRDNYTCQICEQYSGVLHADHIERWADNEDLRYTVSNGRTLCVPCHYYITFKRKMKPGTRWCNFTARKRG